MSASDSQQYTKPTIRSLGKLSEITLHGASHAGNDGKWYEQQGYYGSNQNVIDPPE